MHRTIRGKLFLTFLVTTLFVVSGMYVFMRSSLNRGFSTLLETRQQEQVKILIEGLTDYYSNNQSWSSLSRDKQKWIELLWQSNPQHHDRPSPWIEQAKKEPNNLWPPAIPEQETKKIFTPLGLRAMLLNADKTLIFGRNEAIRQLSLYPIHYKEKIIGFLGLLPGKMYNQASDIEFIERQSKSFIWIALIMILLSASLALFLTYTLGRPIKRIITAVKELAIGHYEIRLPVESKDELVLSQSDNVG
jgi:two-component system sensor histidine kinase BaeS